MNKVWYVLVFLEDYDSEVYKDSVFTTKEEAELMLEIAKNDDRFKEFDFVDFEIYEFYLNPLSQHQQI